MSFFPAADSGEAYVDGRLNLLHRQALATMAELTRLDAVPRNDEAKAPALDARTTDGGDGAAHDDDRMDTAA